MKYTGLELFMEKLKHIIYSHDNPLIINHPSILSLRPQFQLLYEDFGSVIQTLLLIDEHDHEVKDLKKRFEDAAEAAHDVIDLLVYNVNLNSQSKRNTWMSGYCGCGKPTKKVRKKEIKVNLDAIMVSIKSIKEEFIMIHDYMKTDSSPTTDHIKAGPSSTKKRIETKKASEDIVVGFDDHAALIRDKLVEDQKQLDVVSIVGMGGVGKTTLATKVFNDRFIMHHFHVRGWVTVSQTYERQELFIQILESIGNKIDNHDYSQIRQILRQKLMGKRYLVVIDDIWSHEAWDALKHSFPDDHIGSRILLTSRLNEVAFHAKPHGFIHRLRYLTEEESWELLRKKVFHGSDPCSKWLVEPGMKIAKNCHGLPLVLVVVAGVLAKEPLRKYSWERISRSVSSYIVNGQTVYANHLALSIDHLPGLLRNCFLYLGGFPADHKFRLPNLIWLWMAEGFIVEDGHRSLEEIGEDWLIELVDRNLVAVADRKPNGGIKSFYVHDLLRELCMNIATKENLYFKAQCNLVETFQQRRVFVDHNNIVILNAPMIRSLLCFYRIDDTSEIINKWSGFWMLLMVLDLRGLQLIYFPKEMAQLVHLRYFAIWYHGDDTLPSSICRFWSLQTLIIRKENRDLKLPKAISNLQNLRHLMCDILFPVIEEPMNLQTISRVTLEEGIEDLGECFPDIKKLSWRVGIKQQRGLKALTSLEHLKLSRYKIKGNMKFIAFPTSLKSLVLKDCYAPWSDMSIIQALPNLEVLKLHSSFTGSRWDAGEKQFQQLKFLKLSELGIKEWKASSINFPCLKQLVVQWCYQLEEIPLDFGNIPTLDLISVCNCKGSVVESLDTIKDEQHAQGNFELNITIKEV